MTGPMLAMASFGVFCGRGDSSPVAWTQSINGIPATDAVLQEERQMQLMQEQHYWREVHRLSTQAEEAHAALDHFLASVRAPFTEEELAAYDELNNAAIVASIQLDEYCQQDCPKRLLPDLPAPIDNCCSVCSGDLMEANGHADLKLHFSTDAGAPVAVDAVGLHVSR